MEGLERGYRDTNLNCRNIFNQKFQNFKAKNLMFSYKVHLQLASELAG